jgi:hypothetical protein
MSKLNFRSILFEAYIPWPRFAGKLLKSLSGLQVEESLIKNFEGLSQRLGKNIFDFDPIKKTIQVIDWSKMARADVEEILRSSKIRTILYNELKNNGIDINDSSVRTTLTGVYRVLADSFVNSAKKVVTKDWTTITVVKNFIDGMKLSATELIQMIPLVKKLVKDSHFKYLKQQDVIEREVIKLTNEIIQKKKSTSGLEKEFDELNKLFAQMTALDKQEHKVIWVELEKKLPKEFMELSKKGFWKDKKYVEFIKYFQGDLEKPPKVVFEKIEAAKKLLPKNLFKKGNETGKRLINTALQWDPRTLSETKQTMRVFGTSKYWGKTITDKVLFGLIVYPSVIAALKSILDGLENVIKDKTGVSLPLARGEDFERYFSTQQFTGEEIIWLDNLLNLVPNTFVNYIESFHKASSGLRTLPGWSPLLSLLNVSDFTKKSTGEKIKIIKDTKDNLEEKVKNSKETVQQDLEGTSELEKLKNLNLENLDNNTPNKKEDFVNPF